MADGIQADVPESIREIDSFITQYQHVLSILSRCDPRRPLVILRIATQQSCRHTLSNEKEDLDKVIDRVIESILQPPRSWLQHGPMILGAFFFLALSLLRRSKLSNQPKDVIYAVKYFFHLRDQHHEIPRIPRHKVTTLLVEALALNVELEVGNVMQNIREMAVLSRELLTLETSDVNPTRLIILIYVVVKSKLHPDVPDQPLDEIIEFLRAAREHRPDLLEGRIALAVTLAYRYRMTLLSDDHEEAMSILDEPIPSSPGDGSVCMARGFATCLAIMRLATSQTPEYLEEAIYRCRTCFFSSSVEEQERYAFALLDPELTATLRFLYFGSVEGIEDSESSQNLVLSRLVLQKPEFPTEFRQTIPNMMDLVYWIHNTDDVTKIDETVEKSRSMLVSSPHAATLALFGDLLYEAFDRTNKIEYLNESISIRRQVIEYPQPDALRFMLFPFLSKALIHRSLSFPGYRTQDLDEALEKLSLCANNINVGVPDRFLSACQWALSARLTGHPSVSSAYETALLLMQDTLPFSPTLQLQHATLATETFTQGLPLDYASYLLDCNLLEEAIELLERGRALLWSEMHHLRVSIDHLLEVDPDLGHKFAAVNRDFEELTKSVPPSHKLGMDDVVADGLRAVDPFGRLLLKQRALLKERAELISQIQALPGLDSFLTSPLFNTLRSAASSGPVILINHSMWRSDILVLLHNMPPSLIPTPDDFFKRAGELKDNLLGSRQKFGLDSNHYNDTLASVLGQLYTLVGRPVIDRLRHLQVPEQSRIWWCPTSVFSSLPLHAMGPIPSDDGEPRYFLDLYISSYTQTLSALIQSRHRDSGSRSLNRPSILLVAQPDSSLPTVGGEIQAVKALDTEVTSLISEAATPSTVIDGFHHHRFVHFACHCKLKAGKPFEAGFELYGGARLTLLEIVRSHIPTAEFAFLSACHTAEVTEGSIMDEGLHLAAAVQYCGFRSVVGTMWAMVDEDGRDLAENFYKALFSNSRGIPYHERSAKALRFAVKKLRRKRSITLERWVNFVHYGA